VYNTSMYNGFELFFYYLPKRTGLHCRAHLLSHCAVIMIITSGVLACVPQLYKNQSEAAKKVAMSLLNSPGWKQEGQLASRDTKKYGRMYKLEVRPGKGSYLYTHL